MDAHCFFFLNFPLNLPVYHEFYFLVLFSSEYLELGCVRVCWRVSFKTSAEGYKGSTWISNPSYLQMTANTHTHTHHTHTSLGILATSQN